MGSRRRVGDEPDAVRVVLGVADLYDRGSHARVRQTPDLADLRCRDPHARADVRAIALHCPEGPL